MQTFFKNTNHYCTATVLFVLLLGGCATYHPKLLPASADLAPGVEQLNGQGTALHERQNGLSLDDVAVFAVFNNPDLKARRKQLGIKQAELYAEGLLPDPQLSASLDHPTDNMPDLFNGYGIGLGYDLIPLITRRTRLDSAKGAQEQARLEILWQEWQVSQRARILAVDLDSQHKQIALLEGMRKLYEERYHRSHEAVSRGDVTLAVAGTDLTALLDTLSRISQLQQSANDTLNELRLLLGLSPDAPLKISLTPLSNLPDVSIWRKGLQTLPQRRPDLLALKAGYQSQEAKVRAAILSQFPSLSIGINRARDTSNVHTTGFSIDLNLPLFSGNRGGIAIERATREQLTAEYQARLDATATEIDRLIRLQGLISEQMTSLNEYMPVLKTMVDNGRAAYGKGDIDAITFLNMENTWVAKRLEQIDLAKTQRTNLIALRTLLALPVKGTTPENETQGGKQP